MKLGISSIRYWARALCLSELDSKMFFVFLKIKLDLDLVSYKAAGGDMHVLTFSRNSRRISKIHFLIISIRD